MGSNSGFPTAPCIMKDQGKNKVVSNAYVINTEENGVTTPPFLTLALDGGV
jgi:hypothetical protein